MARSSRLGCGGCLGLVIVGFVVLGVISVLVGPCDDHPASHNTRRAIEKRQEVAPSTTPVPVVFDVPSLVGKSIDEVKSILGQPEDREPEPTQLQLEVGVTEWNNLFVKDAQDLLVVFDPRTRQVVEFFLSGDDGTVLMRRANVRQGGLTYRIEAVKAIRDPSRITGIRIIPLPED